MYSKRSGYIYILSNEAMPGILKIGRSVNGGRSRANDLYKSGGTGVPMPFKMEFEVWSNDCILDESSIHEELDDYRINSSREFFRIDTQDAISAILRNVVNEYDLTVGLSDFTVTENDLLSSYGFMSESLINDSFPGAPIAIVLAHAIAYHLDINAVHDAVNAYKTACNERRAKLSIESLH